MKRKELFTIAHNTNTVDDSSFTKCMSIGVLIAFIAIVCMAMCTKVQAQEVIPVPYEHHARLLSSELDGSLKKGDLDRAEQLARIAASIEQARAARAAADALKIQTAQLQRLDNLFRSAPAFMDGFERIINRHGDLKEGSEDWMMFQLLKLALRSADRPLTTDEVLSGLKLRK